MDPRSLKAMICVNDAMNYGSMSDVKVYLVTKLQILKTKAASSASFFSLPLVEDSFLSSWRSLLFHLASFNGPLVFVDLGETLVGVSSAESRAGVRRGAAGGG